VFRAISFTWEMKNHLFYKRARCNSGLLSAPATQREQAIQSWARGGMISLSQRKLRIVPLDDIGQDRCGAAWAEHGIPDRRRRLAALWSTKSSGSGPGGEEGQVRRR
jgi:hypothetical protein